MRCHLGGAASHDGGRGVRAARDVTAGTDVRAGKKPRAGRLDDFDSVFHRSYYHHWGEESLTSVG